MIHADGSQGRRANPAPPSLELHGNNKYLLQVVVFPIFFSLHDVGPQIAQPQQKLTVLSVKVE